MRAGKLRQRVIIQHRTISGQDTSGQDTIDFTSTVSGPFSAEVVHRSGREFASVQQVHAEVVLLFRMRFQPGLVVKRQDRLQWLLSTGDRVLDIVDAEDPDGRRREFQIACKELVA